MPTTFFLGGSCWVWDARDPRPNGAWRLYLNRWPVDVEAAEFLAVDKVEAIRQQAESLVDAFPGTELHLDHLGCTSTHLIRKPILDTEDVRNWATSIWNACVPAAEDNTDPGDWPWLVMGTAALVRGGFHVAHPDQQGNVAVLPLEDGESYIYWCTPSSVYATMGRDVLGARHPVSVHARRDIPST